MLYCKFKDLCKKPLENGVILQQKANNRVIEFKKQGLPHVHLLTIATQEFNACIMDPKNLDKIITVEMPSETTSL